MSQKPDMGYEAPAGPPPPSYTPSQGNIPKPSNTFSKTPDAGPNNGPNAGGNYAPGPPMTYPQAPPPGQYPPPQPAFNYPPPGGPGAPAGYYGPQGNMPNGGYGQPPYGAYPPGNPPQGQYVNERKEGSGPGFAQGLLAACACCCCLDLLF